MVLKKLWKNVAGDLANSSYLNKAIIQHDAVEAGEKVKAPKHPTDQRHFEEALKNEAIAKDIRRKNEELITKVNKITITSFENPEVKKSSKPLPTRESEWLNRDTPDWKFGYHEIPPEKMEANTVMLREVFEMLNIHACAEFQSKDGQNELTGHPGYQRLSTSQRENLLRFFAPFTRRDRQRVVEMKDLDTLRDFMNNNVGEINIDLETDFARKFAIQEVQKMTEKNSYLPDTEAAKKFDVEKSKRRLAEAKRLESKMKELKEEK